MCLTLCRFVNKLARMEISTATVRKAVVLPEWIDANGHMNLAYYVVLFDQATDLLYDALGVGQAYRDATGNSTFTAETHTLYEREVRVGERVRVVPHLLGADAKRLHYFHEMFHAEARAPRRRAGADVRCTSTCRCGAWRRFRRTLQARIQAMVRERAAEHGAKRCRATDRDAWIGPRFNPPRYAGEDVEVRSTVHRCLRVLVGELAFQPPRNFSVQLL